MVDEKKEAPPSVEDLKEMILVFNQVTEKMHKQHAALELRVSELQRELADKNLELERSRRLAALGELSAGIAHEIRNPLGGIELSASLLEGEVPTDSQKRLVSKILKGVAMLNSIVTEFMEFANYRSPALEDTALCRVVEEAAEYAAKETAEHGHSVDSSAVAADAVVRGDGPHLVRALLNLILNAAQAMESPGRIIISSRRAGPNWELNVADTGPGFSDKALERAFNPFFTTKDCGTGLGLSIVHKIIESHGGSVRIGNRPEGGAVVTVVLPTAGGGA
jgi:signal transduction histidine kinase